MDSDRWKKDKEPSLHNGGGHRQIKSVFGVYSDSDLLSWVKGLALDPCASEASHNLARARPLWNQTLKMRKVMALSGSEFPWRKRKLQEFLKENFVAGHGLTFETSNQRSVPKLTGGQLSHAFSISCLFNSVDSPDCSTRNKILLYSSISSSLLTSEDNFPGKQVPTRFFHSVNALDWSSSNKDGCPLVESDESVNGSVPVSPENLTLHDLSSLESDDSVHSSNASSSDEIKHAHLQTPQQSIGFLNFISDHLERMVIPVGPRFQADVPEWTGPANCIDSENSRWLGTQLWPLEDTTTETTAVAVGRGRPDSCSCISPGSIDCTNRHILEERLLLQSDLGPAFMSWKFDEIGDEVSHSWTLKAKERFDSLTKMYLPSNGRNLLKHALKCFPSKGKESIASYYFNVLIPRRLSLRTRSSLKQVDSDANEMEKDIDHRKKFNGRNAMIGGSEDVKTRYMRLRS